MYQIAYGEPFAFGHCPGNSDSALSGKPDNHCPGNSDTNWKEQDPGIEHERIEGWDEPQIEVPIGWDWGLLSPRVGNFTASATSSRRAPKPAWSAGTAATCRTIGGVGPRTYAMA